MKFCMIGWRGHSAYTIEGLKQLSDFTLSAIASGEDGNDGRYILDMLQKHGVMANVPVFADWIEMLDRIRPDVVSIDGPYHLHGITCLECARRGIHIFCEKPISFALEELAELEALCKESGTKIVSMTGLRYLPEFYHAHKLVASGAIGKVKLIQTQKSYKLGKRPAYYKQRATYGGTIPWVGSHAIDWILWFSASSFESIRAFHDINDNFDHGEMEIAGQCLFRMKNGVMASASVDFLRPASAPTHDDDRIRVTGTRGVIEVRERQLHLLDEQGLRQIEAQGPAQSFFEDFIGSLRGGNPSPVANEDTFELARCCLLARNSADQNMAKPQS